MSQQVIQRCVFPIEHRFLNLYYRLDRPLDGRTSEPEKPSRFSMTVDPGHKLITDTYFNSLFECYWRRYTRLEKLQLRLELSGQGSILLLRRSLAAGLSILDVVEFDGDDVKLVLDVPEPSLHYREAGALHFDLVAKSSRVRLHKAEWVAVDVDVEPVSLVAGYCTFNREKFLLANVRGLIDDPGVSGLLERIVVVDQGTNRVRDHADFERIEAASCDKLRVIEQGNFGGTGGFTRSILEARSIEGASHMLLMDDDAITEPESVFRVAAFQALAREDMGVGGQMLDMLRPMEVYESGALLDPPSLGVTTPIHRLHAVPQESLSRFLEVSYIHYNAWWFFAFPLRLVDKVGLPLPVFIRGDDVEFGYRLHRAGVTTTTVPGLGIWHEPFYLKRGSWQAYYDLRNMLVIASLHHPLPRKHVVKTFLRRVIMQLLSLNYSEAEILCEAADDFIKGPGYLESDPQEIHRKVVAMKKAMTTESVPRSKCLPTVHPAAPPVTAKQRRRHLIRSLFAQFTRPTPPAHAQPGYVIPDDYARWWYLAEIDVVAAEDWHTDSHRVYRRSREAFLRIFKRAVRIAWRLYHDHQRVGDEWRGASGRLTSTDFWRGYLGINRAEDQAEAADEWVSNAA